MSIEPITSAVPIHLGPGAYHVVGPEEFGAPGLRALEAVGPYSPIAALGPLVTVQDRRFEPNSGSSLQPHRGMERLLYVIEGEIAHGDSVPEMEGTIRTGDLAILTEGQQGMRHSERNEGDVAARAYVLTYPADPLPEDATFHVLRDASMPRRPLHQGVEIKVVIERESSRVHGQVYEVADIRFDVGAASPIVLQRGEGAVLFCLEGGVRISSGDEGGALSLGPDETALFPPTAETRRVLIYARVPSRVLRAVTGTGFGVRLQEPK